jgi:hypothetical protein
MSEPGTEAGRDLLALIDRNAPHDADPSEEWVAEWWAWRNEIEASIVKVETEAAGNAEGKQVRHWKFDEEHVTPRDEPDGGWSAQVIEDGYGPGDHWSLIEPAMGPPHPLEEPIDTAALPPCPICGKDDLFRGTDGKLGCPHCEVAVVL